MYLNIDMFIEVIRAAYTTLEFKWDRLVAGILDVCQDMPRARILNPYIHFAAVCRRAADEARELKMRGRYFYGRRGLKGPGMCEYAIPCRQLAFDIFKTVRWRAWWFVRAPCGQIVRVEIKGKTGNDMCIEWFMYGGSQGAKTRNAIKINTTLLPPEFNKIVLASGQTLAENIADGRYCIYPDLKTTSRITVGDAGLNNKCYDVVRAVIDKYIKDI
jgi:hypothetical protein